VFTMSGRTAQAYTISLLYGNAREKLACHKDLAVMSAYGADLAEKFGIKFNISM